MWGRRHADIFALHVADMGGELVLSEAQLSLCRRAATIETELEAFEARLSVGEDVDIDLMGRLVGQLRRLFECVGLQRAKRDITPSLSEYLAAKQHREAAE